MNDDRRRASSEDLKRKPTRRRTQASTYRNTGSSKRPSARPEADDIIYSHSAASRKKTAYSIKQKKLLMIVFNVFMSLVIVASGLFFVGASLLDSQYLRDSNIDEEEEAGLYEELRGSNYPDVAYFLVCGIDNAAQLTDIMMVVCYDIAHNTANILQIPRDTYVTGYGKANAVFNSAREGESKINSLIRCVNSKFGLPIDYYITFTIDGAEKMIDTLGGVDITLTRDYILVDDTGSEDVSKTFYAGENHLDGQWSVAFMRHRASYNQGDLGRVKAQRSFYAALMKKMLNMSMGDVTSVVKNCFSEISTNLTLGQILGYAEKIHGMDMNDVSIFSVPGQSTTRADSINTVGYYASFYSIHKQEYVDMLNDYFMPYETKVFTVDDLEITEMHSVYDPGYDDYLDSGTLSEFDNDADAQQSTTSSE